MVFSQVLCHIASITPSAVLAQLRFVAMAQDACPGRKVHAQGIGFLPWAQVSCSGQRIHAWGELARGALASQIAVLASQDCLAGQNGVLAIQHGF